MIDAGTRVEFHCPKCLGMQYGTSGVTNWDTAEGVCYGPTGDGGCRFRWPRSEDWRYFYVVNVKKFESKEEFEKERV